MNASRTLLLTALASALAVSACSEKPQAETTAPAAAAPSTEAAKNPDIFSFKIGALNATALKDGDIDAPNDGKTFGVGQPTADVGAVLTAAGQPADVMHLSIQPLLVRSGDRVMLFDTGAAGASFARAGRLPASLRAAGVEPSQVTDIFISHHHQDHVGGLVQADGKRAFANAKIHLSAPEWETIKADTGAAALVAAIAPNVETFQPGAEIVPGVVKAVALSGHTPGHSAYEISSGDQRLLYIGDTAHHFVISVQRPDWTIDYDENAAAGGAARKAMLKRAADEDLRVYAVHFPFPGLGRIRAQGDGFVWVPEQ